MKKRRSQKKSRPAAAPEDLHGDQRRQLKAYLSRYCRAHEQCGILQARLRHIHAETDNPAADIRTRIQRQAEAARECMAEIVDVLDLLPVSTERTILELRHIDCKSWWEIQHTVHLSRSSCYAYYQRGLDWLLAMPVVRGRLKYIS